MKGTTLLNDALDDWKFVVWILCKLFFLCVCSRLSWCSSELRVSITLSSRIRSIGLKRETILNITHWIVIKCTMDVMCLGFEFFMWFQYDGSAQNFLQTSSDDEARYLYIAFLSIISECHQFIDGTFFIYSRRSCDCDESRTFLPYMTHLQKVPN